MLKNSFSGKKSTALWQFCTQPIPIICTILNSGSKGLSILNVSPWSVKIQLTLLYFTLTLISGVTDFNPIILKESLCTSCHILVVLLLALVIWHMFDCCAIIHVWIVAHLGDSGQSWGCHCSRGGTWCGVEPSQRASKSSLTKWLTQSSQP